MRGLLWLLLLAALAVGLAVAAGHNDGYVLFVWPPWRAEISLNLLLALTLGGFLALHALLRGVAAIYGLPARVRAYKTARRKKKSAAALTSAMRLMIEGRYGRALNAAEHAWLSGHEPGVAALLALRAAHAMRDAARVSLWRERAAFIGKEVSAALLMTEAELALETRDFNAARAALAQVDGQHIAALRLALRASLGLQDWPAVARHARQLEKHKALTAEQAESLRARARREIVASLSDPAQLLTYWNDLQPREKLDAALVISAARTFIRAGRCIDASRLLEEFLDQRWDSSVISHYADCVGGDNLARISHAEKWLAAHPRDEQLLLALGRLCCAQQLWGKAQSYLEASLAIRPTLAARLELAQLFDQLGRAAEANLQFRAAAMAARTQVE